MTYGLVGFFGVYHRGGPRRLGRQPADEAEEAVEEADVLAPTDADVLLSTGGPTRDPSPDPV